MAIKRVVILPQSQLSVGEYGYVATFPGKRWIGGKGTT